MFPSEWYYFYYDPLWIYTLTFPHIIFHIQHYRYNLHTLNYRNNHFLVTLLCIYFSGRNITVFGSCQVFYERIVLWVFLHNTFHVGVRLIIFLIDIYPRINFMNIWLSIVQKYFCGVTRHKSFGSGLTAINEVRKCVVFILGDISIFIYLCLYYILWIVDLWWNQSLEMSPPLLLSHIVHKNIGTL